MLVCKTHGLYVIVNAEGGKCRKRVTLSKTLKKKIVFQQAVVTSTMTQ